ncbi:uncharacterized protein LOC118418829 [Branchiostoma floridae]|uniref:Uncharacterized protein LOC118418829 n=2 Tax=Branchiostoma floridae TaxID=7739 RepID=A0A9J7LDB7_BRAFL|nr:uncharacterized protein LOC118418829 [Branchiostoma floridae]
MMAARLPATSRGSFRALGCLSRPAPACLARPTPPPAPTAAALQCARTYSEGEKNPANIAGYHPGKVDKFALRATRKVKKGEEYPEEVSYDTMTAARDKLRVMVVTGLTVAAGVGAIWFIKVRKQTNKQTIKQAYKAYLESIMKK